MTREIHFHHANSAFGQCCLLAIGGMHSFEWQIARNKYEINGEAVQLFGQLKRHMGKRW